jgi:hypothetical protein
MMNCRSMSTPMVANLKKLHDSDSGSDLVDPTMYRQLIGSLMYLTHTRPDIQYVVNALSRFMCEPKRIHMVAVKHILRYVRGTIAYGLRYTSSGGVMLHGFTDSDWMGSAVDRKSTFRILIQFRFSYDFLVQQETGLRSPKHCRGRIHCC